MRAAELPAYRMGDVATNDVIATTSLFVVDEKATAEIRSREAQNIDLFVIYSTNHAAFIEGQVRSSLTKMREAFLSLLKATYATDHLTPEVVESQGFKDIAKAFASTTPGPPVSEGVLSAWALGRTADSFLDDWFTPLRRVMEQPICPDRLPDGVQGLGGLKLRLVSVADLGMYVKEQFAWSNSVPGFATNLLPLATAQSNLVALYPQTRRVVASYMRRQLRPNCRFDAHLTDRVKNLVISGLVRIKRFEPGEVVIQRGQIIDQQALAALAEMHKHAKITSLEQQVAVGKAAVQLLGERNLWLAGLLGVTGLVMVLVMIRSRRRKRRELLPVLSSSFVPEGAEENGWAEPSIVDVPPDSQGEWQRRALEAERRADRASTLARSNLMPHLAQQLKDNLVQQLAAQVDEMLDVQASVAEQLLSMEQRLERMHAPLQERLRIYEQRISELEVELAQRGQENEVLLRARIEALRWQMEQERAGARVN